MTMFSYLDLLKNHIDLTDVPFTDRGSRLLVFQEADHSRLFVKLARRFINLDPDIEAYMHRPAFMRDLCLVDETGQELMFETTTHPYAIYFHTRLGDFGLTFQDQRTLSFGLPAGVTAGLRFHISPQYWRQTQRGGEFKSVRDVAYHSNAELVGNKITPEQGGYTVEVIAEAGNDSAIAITIQAAGNLEIEALPFSIACAASKGRWESWFSQVPPVSEVYRRTYAYAWWLMAINLLSPEGKILYEAMAPTKIKYIGLWLWDSALHALAYRHLDAELARNQIRAMLAHQLPNGMVPDAIHDEGVVSSLAHPLVGEVTKPPILAWAALKLHQTDPNPDFLQEVYLPLVRLNAWWFTMNDDDADGLAQYNHPYSSGLDDNPLWDYGMPVESPELNTYLCLQMDSLAGIAEQIGLTTEAAMWRRRATALVGRMIEDFWDEQAGLFWALKDEQRVPVVTPFNLYPLWTGQLPAPICQRLIAHLTNPDEFWGEYIIPTVARSDPHYNPEWMWRGPIWANINYFFVEALQRVGEHELAHRLRSKTLDLIMKHHGIYEYYNADTGDVPASSIGIFGWTAAVFIDLAIQASREEDIQERR